MNLPDNIECYLNKNGVHVLDADEKASRFVYLKTDDVHPCYRYSEMTTDMLQHNVGNNDWHDIWLGEREKQLSLF